MSDSLRHIWTIAKRELSGYFSSPVAYVVIVIFLLLMGFFTFMLGQFFRVGEASLSFSFFRWHPWLYLFLVPAVGMRLWAEERRQGTMELLLTMPITPWQAIVGKFVASWLFLIIALALTFPVVMTISYLGDPDGGAVFAGYLGSALLAGAYLAVTCFTSALTRNQVISFILSVVICFFLILCGWEPVTELLLQVDVRSPWVFVPYFLIFFIALCAGCYFSLPDWTKGKKLITAIAFTLLTATPAGAMYFLQAGDGTKALGMPIPFFLTAGLALAFKIALIITIFRSLHTFSTGLRVIIAIVGSGMLLSVVGAPWTIFVACLFEPDYLMKLVSSFSVMPNFAGFQKGVIDSRNLLYFVSVIGFSLFCNGVVIRNLRAG